MPGNRARLGPRVAAPQLYNPAQYSRIEGNQPQVSNAVEAELAVEGETDLFLSWSTDAMVLDSLARIQLATAAATWCNAYDVGLEDQFLAKRIVVDWAMVMQRCRAAGARHVTFYTSGSTGVCKHIRHREDTLADEARVWATMLQQPGTVRRADHMPVHPPGDAAGNAAGHDPAAVKRVVLLCPAHHIYGFIWGVLLPQTLGVPVVDAELACMPALKSGDLLVAVPDQWAWLATSIRQWPDHVQGVSSTAPLPDNVHQALTTPRTLSEGTEDNPAHTPGLAGQPLARLFQIYGSTETAGVAYRTAPGAAYRLAPGRSRSVEGGIVLKRPDGAEVTLNIQDELQWVDPSGVDIDIAADVHAQDNLEKSAAPGEVAQAGFHILRRTDHSVQIGGYNVSPAWVEQQLRQHPAVHDVSVRLSTLDLPGTLSKLQRLKAFVVLRGTDSASQRQALEQWSVDMLPWYANFSSITYGQYLPVNTMGKLCDWPEAC